MSELPIKQILEGAIIAAGKPLSIDALIQLFGEDEQPSRADVKVVLAEVQADFEGRGFELKEVASGFRFQVRSDYSQWIDKLWAEKAPRYTRAFLETLALIAYKQPITRGDIEEIRGVSVSTNIMRSLMEREWIRVVGHRDVPGRPAIYATTKTFLDYFDLSSLDQLPTLSEIKDLDKMNEELDLGVEDLIQPRTLDLVVEEAEAASEAADDATLDSVIEKVNTIQENIKKVMLDPVDEGELIEDDLDEDDLEILTQEINDQENDVEAGTDDVEADDVEEKVIVNEETESESDAPETESEIISVEDKINIDSADQSDDSESGQDETGESGNDNV